MKKYILNILILLAFWSTAALSNSVRSYNFNSLENSDSSSIKLKALEHFINGSILDLNERYADAVEEYRKALMLDPSAGIFYALGKDYFILNKFPLALKNSKAAVQIESNNIEYNLFLASVYKAARKIDSAEVVYEKIIGLDSTNVEAYYRLAAMYSIDKPIKALSLYKRLLDLT